jgi:hypothetical protein
LAALDDSKIEVAAREQLIELAQAATQRRV